MVTQNKYIRVVVDASTNEIDTKTLTNAEMQKVDSDEIALIAKQKAEAEAKAQAKTTAEGKLVALGLTTDDLKLLLG